MTKKTIKHASADVGLIFTAYNLRRLFEPDWPIEFKQYLKALPLILIIMKHFKGFYSFVFASTNHFYRKLFFVV
jgi:hypothetical protein